MFHTKFDTQFCEIILAGDEAGLKHLHLNAGKGKDRFKISPDWQRNDKFFIDTVTQLKEYFAGKRKQFNVKMAPLGTEFQQAVWKQLQNIPYGETRSYGQIAEAIGRPSGSRAVGAANGRNPIPIIIPCHRVIGSDGKLTGYAYGLEIKKQLLNMEKAIAC